MHAKENTGKFFCFNNNVSNLLLQKYMVWHIFLHFQCLESQIRQQLTKRKRQIFIGQRPFDSRLYLDISRSFKCPKSGLSDLLLLAGRFVSCFCIARIHFQSSHTRQF